MLCQTTNQRWNMKKKAVSLTIPESTLFEISKIAKKNDRSLSFAISEILENHLKNIERVKRTSLEK